MNSIRRINDHKYLIYSALSRGALKTSVALMAQNDNQLEGNRSMVHLQAIFLLDDSFASETFINLNANCSAKTGIYHPTNRQFRRLFTPAQFRRRDCYAARFGINLIT